MKEKDFFYNKELNKSKLINFGFINKTEYFEYFTNIMDNDFKLVITVYKPNIVKTKLTEISTGEIYTLHLTDAEGTFVGQIREEYSNILKQVADNCFETKIFKFEYTYKIIDYIRSKYGDEVEYLWEKFPDNAVARRKDNSKWYLAILTVKKDRLGFDSQEKVEIIDLRANSDEIPELIKSNNIYPGYHMNKKHWISIILDGSVNIDEIYTYIDKSYFLANKI